MTKDSMIQTRVSLELSNDVMNAAKDRGKTVSEFTRDALEMYVYSKQGHLLQAEYFESKTKQHRMSVKFIEEEEQCKKQHELEMKEIERQKQLKGEEVERQKREESIIKGIANKVWQGNLELSNTDPELYNEVKNFLLFWKQRFGNYGNCTESTIKLLEEENGSI